MSRSNSNVIRLPLAWDDYRLLVESVADYAIFMLDPEGRVSTWNLGAEGIKGYKADEIIGEHFSRFFTAEDVAAGKPRTELKRAAEIGRFEDESWRVQRDGSRFWANVVITALRDESGRLCGFGKVTRDRTERKRAEDERERLRTEVADRERLAVLGRVTAGLAHELRNPLAVIRLRVDMACRESADPVRAIEQLGDVSEEIQRLDRLTNDLLTVGGRSTGIKCVCDLASLAQRRASFMAPMLADRGVRLHVVGSANAAVDMDGVARVIDNLERNAVEASSANAEVSVEVFETDGRAIVRVIDSGPGVPAERSGELFEPFFTTKPDGIGLGLALSWAIAAAHRGSLTYRRDEGRTVFELALPAASA